MRTAVMTGTGLTQALAFVLLPESFDLAASGEALPSRGLADGVGIDSAARSLELVNAPVDAGSLWHLSCLPSLE